MKQLRHVLALTLVFCMVFGMVTPSLAISGEISVEEDYGIPVEEDGGIEIEVDDRSDYDIDEDREELSVLPKQDETADETNTTGKVDGYNYNIIHLDCGRKYFSVDSIKQIIDNASAAGFNYIQLAVGNDGMRFLLDDMNLTLDDGTEYDGTAITAAIKAANKAYYDAGTYNELSQSEMDDIIAYAYTKGMGVIPLINTPGHMDAILAAANEATGVNCAYYSTTAYKYSERTIDVKNATATGFTKAFLKKYITYFAGKGCKLFNMGADEYANDTGSPRFSELQNGTGYEKYVEYLNAVSADITSAGMTPMAFNDGIYYNKVDKTEIDNSIIIEYWSGGWGGYDVAQPTYLVNKGFNLVNTHGDWYWIVGGSQIDTTKASQFNYQNFSSKYDYYVNKPDGSTFCIWSDVPGALTDEEVATNTAPVISAFGGTLPTVDSVTNGGTTDPAGETVEITLNVGVSTTRTINGVAVTDTIDKGVAKVVAVDASVAGEPTYALADNIESGKKYCISDGNGNYLSVNASGATVNESEKDSPTEWTIKGSGSSYTIKDETTGYYLCYNTSGDDLIASKNSTYRYWSYSSSGFSVRRYNRDYYIRCYNNKWYVLQRDYGHGLPYTKTTTTTEPKTSVTITGKAPGYTTAVVGGVTYNITVNAIEETKSLTVSSGNTAELNVPTLDTSIVGNTTTTYEVTSGSENITVNETNGTITAGTVTEDKTATVVAKVKNAAGAVLATYTYNVTITKENLADVTSITVEYWITNSRLTGETSKENQVTITAQEAFGEGGVDIGTLVDAMGAKDGRTQEYWQSKILDVEKTNNSTSGTELQTTKEGDDETLNGSAFTKIRYYNSKWQVYTTKWTDVDRTQVSFKYTGDNSTTVTYSGDKNQLVAYYMEVVNINNANNESELHVNAADWGTKGDGTGSWGYPPESNRCSVSVQIVYEDGSTNPSDTTAANLKSKTIMYGYWSGGRGLGTMIFSGQQNYQIYKVTAETGDVTSTTGSGNTVTVTNFTWDENEETVWEGDATKSVSIGNPARNPSYVAPYDNLAWNTSEYNNNNAILIRVYVKTSVTEDSLTVHYIDKTLNEEFYNYNIAVASGTYFDSAFGKGGGNTLVNNSVKNINGVTQSVNADLTTMPEISAYYRYSEFTLDSVKRSDNGKEVWLYYTFNNTHNFVVDFGVPLHLEPSDIGIGETSGTQKWDTAELTAGNKLIYGTVDIAAGEGLTYTPTSVMKGVETIGITLSESNSTAKPATHFIYLYPATNVLYEEDVITNPAGSGWTTVTSVFTPATDVEGNEITTQSAEKLGNENLHGYDVYYSENTEFSGGSAYMATLDASKTATEYGKPLTFEFTGNGFDLISECGPQTGALLVRVYKDGVLNHGFFVDTYFTGDNIGIINSAADNNGVLDYQVPVVRDINLTHGTYKVEVYGYMVNRSTTSTASLYSVDSAETYLEQALKDLGLDDDASLYEVSFMDENSVLNDNAVASDVVRSGVSVQSMADEVMAATDNTQYVYVDGIRVYHTIDAAAEPEYTASEQDVTYYDIYDIAKKSGMTIGSYLVYVEGEGNRATLENYHNKGPQNEIYLTSGNTLAFKLDGYTENQINLKSIQISARAVTEEAAFVDNGKPIPIATNTEMYYSVQLLTTSDTKEYYLSIKCPKNTDGTNSMLSIGAIKLPNGVTIAEATESVKADVLRRAKAQDSDEFIPSSFTVNVAESVKAGKRFYLGAQTSIDVDKLIVEYQGFEYEITPDNAGLVSLGVADVYTYSCGFKAPKRGVADSVTVTVKAHKAGTDDVYSAPVTRTVVVK